jgi:hypothetical protein
MRLGALPKAVAHRISVKKPVMPSFKPLAIGAAPKAAWLVA